MATLNTVADYVTEARVLLQDTVAPYRYVDDDLVTGLNMAMYEIARLRPDVMIDAKYTTTLGSQSTLGTLTTPTYTADSQSTAVAIPIPYRLAALYYICGNAQLRDNEEVQDQRAAQFLQKFTAQMLVIQS